jgi:tumor protein p53-inducible protein 3
MSVPEKMRAVLLKGFGDRDNLYIGETDVPKIKDDEVLVKVHAFGVNRADTSQRKGQYPPPPGVTDIIGLEASGEIVEVGNEAKQQWNNGDKVMVLVSGGGYAEYVTVHMGCVMKIPKGISIVDAAGIPEAYLTAFQGLRLIGNIKKGDIALIHAGASGVGTAAIQLAKLFGAKVATTAGSNGKVAYCHKLGADKAVNYQHGPWVKEMQEFTRKFNKDGFDIIYESIGKDYVEANQEVIGVDSRWIVYSHQSGPQADKLSFTTLMKKRITLSGTVLRARSIEYKTNLVKQFQDEAINGFVDGQLKVIIDKTWPMEQIAEAHKYMEDNLTMGKIVITVIQDKQ